MELDNSLVFGVGVASSDDVDELLGEPLVSGTESEVSVGTVELHPELEDSLSPKIGAEVVFLYL